jgi:hypothetical protein
LRTFVVRKRSRRKRIAGSGWTEALLLHLQTAGDGDETAVTAAATATATTAAPVSPASTASKQPPKKPRAKRSKKDKANNQQPTAVGRGRLPSVDTDKKYLEAVQIYGKDFIGIASHVSKTPEAARKYWERHCDRLGLEKLDDGAGVPAAAVTPAAAPAADAPPPDAPPPATASGDVQAPQAPDAKDTTATAPAATGTSGEHNKKKRQRDRPVWSDDDKQALFDAFAEHGRQWQKLHEAVPSKTLTQVKNFYQNYKHKFAGQAALGGTQPKKQKSDSP